MKRQWTVLFLIFSMAMYTGCASSSSKKSDKSADAFDENVGLEGDEEIAAASEDTFDDEFGDGSGDDGDDFSDADSSEEGDEFADFEDEGTDPESDDEFGDDDFVEDDSSEGDEFAEDNSGEGTEEADEFGDDDFGDDEFAEDDTKPAEEDGFEEDDQSLDTASNEEPDTDFDQPEPPEPDAPQDVVAAPMGESPQTLAKITNIEFNSLEGGQIVISSDSAVQYQTRRNDELGQYIIDIEGVTLPARLQRPFNTRDFEGSVGAINAYQDPGSSTARVIVQMRGPDYPSIQQSGNKLVVTPPATLISDESLPEKMEPAIVDPSRALKGISLEEYLAGNTRFYGKPIYLQYKDADIRDVFNFIAEESGANLVISEQVSGKVSLKLRNVPWDQALVVIMRSNRLGYVRQGNVIRIAPLESLKAETDEAKKIQESKRQIENLKVKVIPVSYADIDELGKQVKTFLSPRGKVVGDKRTGSMVITDIQDSIDTITQLIQNLDVPPPQVLIEGKIVEASEGFQESVGVNWSLTPVPVNIGSGTFRPRFRSDAVSGAVGGGFQFDASVGTVDVLGDLTTAFAMAEKQDLVKIISSPRIMTMHNQPAEITQTSEIPLQQTQTTDTGQTTTSIAFKPVSLTLKVNPQVTSSRSVIMGVEVVREFLGAVTDAVTQVAPVNSRSAKTKVLVEDGQTAVIGGIYQSDATKGVNGIPGWMDLPFIGGLFRTRIEKKQHNELLIFITPRIASSPTKSRQF